MKTKVSIGSLALLIGISVGMSVALIQTSKSATVNREGWSECRADLRNEQELAGAFEGQIGANKRTINYLARELNQLKEASKSWAAQVKTK